MNRISFLNRGYTFKGLLAVYHAEIYFFPITCATDFFFLQKKIAFSPLFRLQKTLCCIFQKANTCFGRAIQVRISLRFVSKHR